MAPKDQESEERSCFFCGAQGDRLEKCKQCQNVNFCSKEHRKLHRSETGQCYLFTVARSEGQGRFLVANRDVSPGETLFVDAPLVIGPANKSPAACLECFRLPSLLSRESDRCPECGLPLCRDCQARRNGSSAKSFHQMECHLFKETFERISSAHQQRIFESIDVADDKKPCALYASLSALRLLQTKAECPDIWEDHIGNLMDHEEQRKKDQTTWMLSHMLVVSFLRGACRLPFSADEIQRAIGIIRTNGVKLDTRSGQASGIGLYPTFSLLNHNCQCNTRTKKNADGNGSIELVATMQIPKGHEISTRYATPQWGTIRRQQMLQSHWYFTCQCVRCQDPTECGTMLSAVKCSECVGYLLPIDPLNIGSEWKCQGCHREIAAARVMEMILKIESRIEKELSLPNVEQGQFMKVMEILEAKYLHPNHFLLVLLKEKLIQSLVWHQKQPNTPPGAKLAYLNGQIKWFEDIHGLMRILDPPGDLWEDTLHKMRLERDAFSCSLNKGEN